MASKSEEAPIQPTSSATRERGGSPGRGGHLVGHAVVGLSRPTAGVQVPCLKPVKRDDEEERRQQPGYQPRGPVCDLHGSASRKFLSQNDTGVGIKCSGPRRSTAAPHESSQ